MKRLGARLAVRGITAVLVAGSAGLGFMPLAHADTTATLSPSAAAWYQPNPSCATPAGCVTTGSLPVAPLVDVPLSPYPAGTLHVAYTGASAQGQSQGQETARSYLAFPYSSVDGTATAATLDVPLDTSSQDGSAQPETSHVQVCLVSAPITATEGSVSPPPQASCDSHAALKYVATPTPHLHADLAPLLGGLLTTSGLALLPDAPQVRSADAWHVVFSSKDNPPVLKLSVTPSSSDVGEELPPVDVPTQAPVDTGTGTGQVTQPVIPDTSTPVVPDTSGSVPGPTVPTTNVPATTNVAQPQTVTVGYAYPAVWLLPLAFLVLVPLAARALTKDLTPVAPPPA